MTIEELRSRQQEIRERLQEIDSQYAGQRIDPDSDDGQEWSRLNEEFDANEDTIRQLEDRTERIRALSENPGAREEGATFHTPRSRVRGDDIYDLTTVRASAMDPAVAGEEMRDRALQAIERSTPAHPDFDPAKAKAHAERLVRNTDSEDGKFARYLLAVGSPTYKRAFSKTLRHLALNRDEQAAVMQAQAAERAMSLTGASGGFAVPFELDPTILNTSNGVLNPIRQISRVESITVDEWRGISSAGVTASYAAEAAEVGDNSPTLAQPSVSTERAHAFVPASIEISMDWTGLAAQLAELFQEARDQVEAAKFISGTGTLEPFGVLTGTTTTVNAAAGQTFTLANLYSLKGALPPRYRPRGAFVGDSLIYDRVRQFDTVGSSAAIWVDGLQDDNPPRLLGKPAYEASEMPDTPATGNKFLLYGDFSRYLIADRVGMSIEYIPHLFGANRRPTGERGWYAFWRNGAKVLDANAFRALVGVV